MMICIKSESLLDVNEGDPIARDSRTLIIQIHTMSQLLKYLSFGLLFFSLVYLITRLESYY